MSGALPGGVRRDPPVEHRSCSRRGARARGALGLRLYGGTRDSGVCGSHEGADGGAPVCEGEEVVDHSAETGSLHPSDLPGGGPVFLEGAVPVYGGGVRRGASEECAPD